MKRHDEQIQKSYIDALTDLHKETAPEPSAFLKGVYSQSGTDRQQSPPMPRRRIPKLAVAVIALIVIGAAVVTVPQSRASLTVMLQRILSSDSRTTAHAARYAITLPGAQLIGEPQENGPFHAVVYEIDGIEVTLIAEPKDTATGRVTDTDEQPFFVEVPKLSTTSADCYIDVDGCHATIVVDDSLLTVEMRGSTDKDYFVQMLQSIRAVK